MVLLSHSLMGQKILGVVASSISAEGNPDLNVSNCANFDMTTFANGTPNGFDATSNGNDDYGAGTADEIEIIVDQEYIVKFDLVLNSGTAPSFNLVWALDNKWTATDEDMQLSSAGSNEFVFTGFQETTAIMGFVSYSATTDYEVTNLSVKLN